MAKTAGLCRSAQSPGGGLPPAALGALNYNNRIEFSTLETQQALAGLDLRNRQAGAYPRLLLTGAYGFTGSAQSPGGWEGTRPSQGDSQSSLRMRTSLQAVASRIRSGLMPTRPWTAEAGQPSAVTQWSPPRT